MKLVYEDRRKRKADRRKEERIWRQRWREAGIHQQVVAFVLGMLVVEALHLIAR